MPGAVSLIVDTNLFHECLSLDAPSFPWSDLGSFDLIELIVSDTVQSELDRQKKDMRPRVKRRAVQAVIWFREMLRSGTREHVFREREPRVVMRVTAQTASPDYPGLLDLAVDDDRIVGVAVALKQAAPECDLRVLSHDSRPISKADAVGLPFKFIPDTWIRQPEADDHEREVASLRAEINELRASHPALSVAAVGAVDKRISITREALAPLTEEEVASISVQLSERFGTSGIEEKAARAASARQFDALLWRGDMVRTPPADRDVKRYREQIHPAWIESCVSHVAGLPTTLNSRIAPPAVTVTLDNAGYRPAENVRIRFTARGPVLVAPLQEDGYVATFPDLPQAPRPPTDQWLRNGMPVGFATPVDDLYHPIPFDMDGLHAARVRDDEGWYYTNGPEEPVVYFEVECRRFRHATKSIDFEVLIFPQSHEAVVRGALEVEVSASNVSRPLIATFPVTVNTTFAPSLQAIQRFLDGQDPTGT